MFKHLTPQMAAPRQRIGMRLTMPRDQKHGAFRPRPRAATRRVLYLAAFRSFGIRRLSSRSASSTDRRVDAVAGSSRARL